jgi:NTP-dependent ternary system trypsin peptidase co-occuring protein
MEALRAELAQASADAARSTFQFPMQSVELEFQVAVRREGRADGKVKFWVIEAGTAGGLTKDEIHKVKVVLGAPIGPDGVPVRIGHDSDEKP